VDNFCNPDVTELWQCGNFWNSNWRKLMRKLNCFDKQRFLISSDGIFAYNSYLHTAAISTSQVPTNTWFLGPIRVSHPNGISIGSVVFARHIRVTNTQTDKPRYVRHL